MSDPGKRDEDPKARVDRELIELLNELRVALPGVQVLFAFLLIVPFSNGFSKVTGFQKDVYFVTLLLTALSTALFIAPTTYHRLHFRTKDKEQLLFTSNRLSIAGTVFLALSIAGAVFFVTDVLFRLWAASVTTAVVAGWFTWFWYGLPLSRKLNESRPDAADGAS
jgi:Family of unknown function (DUF6328)